MGKGCFALSKGSPATWEGKIPPMSKLSGHGFDIMFAERRLQATAPPSLGRSVFIYDYRYIRHLMWTLGERTLRQHLPTNREEAALRKRRAIKRRATLVYKKREPPKVLERDPDGRATSFCPTPSGPSQPPGHERFARGTSKLFKKLPSWEDADATMCVICQGPVARTDVLWLATDCAPHMHLYHAPCLASWWTRNDHHNCPRCTRPVRRFVVRARVPDGKVAWRVYRTLVSKYLPVEIAGRWVVECQACGLDGAFKAAEARRRARGGGLGWVPTLEMTESFVSAIVEWTAPLWNGQPGRLAREGRQVCTTLQRVEMRVAVLAARKARADRAAHDARLARLVALLGPHWVPLGEGWTRGEREAWLREMREVIEGLIGGEGEGQGQGDRD